MPKRGRPPKKDASSSAKKRRSKEDDPETAETLEPAIDDAKQNAPAEVETLEPAIDDTKHNAPAAEVKQPKKTSQAEPKPKQKDAMTTPQPRQKPIFLRKKIDVVVSLLPSSLHDCEQAVKGAMYNLLLKNSQKLGGILLAFENLKLKVDGKREAKGSILNELPYIHYNASCDALVFRPRIGCELRGIVRECFPSHVGVLVLNYFNAMISGEQLKKSGYTYDTELQNWTTGGGTETISIRDNIHFKVKRIHECEGMVSLEGTDPSLSLVVES